MLGVPVLRKLYDKIFSIKILKKLTANPFFAKLLSYEILSYLFFGVMTTVVNFAVFFVSDKILGNASLTDFSVFGRDFSVTLEDVSTVIAWIFAVLFAYVTNKLWVFESKSRKPSVVLREIISFFGARIVSFIVFESVGFMLLRNILINTGVFGSEDFCKWLAKITVAVFVVIFNYIMSKLVIFRNKRKETENTKDEFKGN